MLELKNINHHFNNIQILQNVNLSIKSGMVYGLLGPSGSGKSTLLYIASLLIKPNTGSIMLEGEDLLLSQHTKAIKQNNFGFIFQSHNLIPELTGEENILIAQSIAKKIDEKYTNLLLEELEIAHLKNKKVQDISGGEAQRFAIARAFASKPKIVFADEPTGNLDSTNAQNTIQLILKISKLHNTAILVVTHNHEFIKYFNESYKIQNKQLILI